MAQRSKICHAFLGSFLRETGEQSDYRRGSDESFWLPRRWHENRVTRNGADLIWLGRQVITGQYLDIVNTHHSLQSVWGWRMIFLSFIASLTSQRLNIAYKYPAEKYWNAKKWFCTKPNTAAALTYTVPAKVKAWEHKTFVFAAQLPLAGFYFEIF